MLLCCCTGTNAASRSSLFAFFPLPPLLLGRLEPAPSRPPPPLFRIPALFAMNAINLGVKIGISIATLVNTGCVSRKLVAGISRGNHIYYTSRLYFRAGMKIHSAKLNMMKEKKKRERENRWPFSHIFEKANIERGKKNWIANHSTHCNWNIWIIVDIFRCYHLTFFFFIDEELTFKTIAVYIYMYIYAYLTINIERFQTADYHRFRPPPKGTRLMKSVISLRIDGGDTSSWRISITGYFFFSRIDTNHYHSSDHLSRHTCSIPVPLNVRYIRSKN